MALIPSGYRWRMSPTTVAGHVFAQCHIPYESAPTGYGRGQTDVPELLPVPAPLFLVFAAI